MELYLLDTLYRKAHLFDRFESLIWTERFSSFGDFKLIIESTPTTRSLFKPGALLGLSESYRMMIAESVEDKTDDDGRRVLEVQGPSAEAFMKHRAAARGVSLIDTTLISNWTITKPPADLVREIVKSSISSYALDGFDNISFLRDTSERFSPQENVLEPPDPITVKVLPAPLYDVVKEICDSWQMGFRFVKPHAGAALYFEVYCGNNRTSGQSSRTPVIFSPELDNLQNITSLRTIENAKNIAYVFSPAGFEIVRPESVDPYSFGFERRVLTVSADDVEAGTPNASQILRQRGFEALAQAKAINAFDGEINQNSRYIYGVDYSVGDLVEIRNIDGVANQMRVTEQIFVSDREGDRSYPTLELATFINEGSWMSWRSNITWGDLATDPITWSEQP